MFFKDKIENGNGESVKRDKTPIKEQKISQGSQLVFNTTEKIFLLTTISSNEDLLFLYEQSLNLVL